MESVNKRYGAKRATREKDYLNVELKYKESLLFLVNEEIDEFVEIIDLVRKGELVYNLQLAAVHLQQAALKRDNLVDDIRELKGKLNDEDGYIY